MRVEELMSSLFIAEQEASWLRFYIDEPAFTDLHWVTSIPGLNGIFCNFFMSFIYTEEHYIVCVTIIFEPEILFLIKKSVSCFFQI